MKAKENGTDEARATALICYQQIPRLRENALALKVRGLTPLQEAEINELLALAGDVERLAKKFTLGEPFTLEDSEKLEEMRFLSGGSSNLTTVS